MSKPPEQRRFLAAVGLLALLILVSSGIVLAQTVTPGATLVSGEELISVRFRSFANTGGDELYLGVPDLGVAANRVARQLTWPSGPSNVTFVYDPIQDKLTATVENANGTTTAEYLDVSTKAPNTFPLSRLNLMQIQVANRDSGNITFNNVVLNGVGLGDFAAGDKSGVFDWSVSEICLADGFTLTGTINRSGAFSNSQEGSKVQIVAGVDDDGAFQCIVDAPSIRLAKTPAAQEIDEGQDATFALLVTNNGNEALTNVTAVDAVCDGGAPVYQSGDTSNTGVLDVGETWLYACTVTEPANDFTNAASVTADAANTTVSDQASAYVRVIKPRIDIEKLPPTQDLPTGQDADFTLQVTNTGTRAWTSVTVTDSVCTPNRDISSDVGGDGVLSPAEVWLYDCTVPWSSITGDFRNFADVAVTDGQESAQDRDFADVRIIDPNIDLEKLPTYQAIRAGQTASFEFFVTNTGDQPLENIDLQDARCDGGAPTRDDSSDVGADGILSPGERWRYTCVRSNVQTDFFNSAVVSGEYADGRTVADDETAQVDVINPVLNVSKEPALATFDQGDTVNFTINVTNDGDSPLTDVDAIDALCDGGAPVYQSGDVSNPDVLDPNETWVYTCDVLNVQEDFTNTVVVNTKDQTGATVSDSATAQITVRKPFIDIEKSPSSQIVVSGATVTFILDVRNNGQQPLTNVALTDACDRITGPTGDDVNPGVLDPDEVWRYICEIDDVLADFTNVAEVEADSANGTVRDRDFADVKVIDPDIDLEKTPVLQYIRPGDTASFVLTATNLGDDPLTDVDLQDGSCDGGAPVYQSGDDGNNILDPGEVWLYACTVANVQQDFTNTAQLTAKASNGDPVSDTETAFVDVIRPSLNLNKTATPNPVLQNQPVTFTFTVWNNGDSNLTQVEVKDDVYCDSDPVRTNNGNGDEILAPNETWTYECVYSSTVDDFTNNATATAVDDLAGPVSDNASVNVDVQRAGIDIEKTPEELTVQVGATVVFDLVVRNTGDQALNNIVITDAQCDGGAPTLVSNGNGDAVLDPGEVWLYTCTVSNIANDLVNVATIQGTDQTQTIRRDEDRATVKVINSNIVIDKSPNYQVILAGADASFTLIVRTTGAEPLSNVVVTDALCTPTYLSGDANSDDKLDPGERWLYSCTIPAVPDDLVNVASVTAEDPFGFDVTDQDSARVVVVDPGLNVTKEAINPKILKGETAEFRILVANNGDVDLGTVAITDPLCQATLLGPGTSDIGGDGIISANPPETWEYTCTVPNVQDDLTNTATIDAETIPGGLPVRDSGSATVEVYGIGIDIEKDPDFQPVRVGGTASWTLRAVNTGETPLSNVTITDSLCAESSFGAPDRGDLNNNGQLDLTEAWEWDCTVGNVQSSFENVATVTATDGNQNQVSDTDTAEVVAINPDIDLEKSPDIQYVREGDDVSFELYVRNVGDQPLRDVEVTDPLCTTGPDYVSGDVNNNNVLDPNEVWTYSCEIANVTQDLTNVASVKAIGPFGNEVLDDNETARVIVINPDINLDKLPDTVQNVPQGGTATFTFLVTNGGQFPLSNVVLADTYCTPTYVDGDTNNDDLLDPSETWTYTCDVVDVQQDFTNTATVTADDLTGRPVSDTDTSDVNALVPGIVLEKKPELQVIRLGQQASWTLTVRNTGEVDLQLSKTGVQPYRLWDHWCVPVFSGGDTNSDDLLNPGEIWSFGCTTGLLGGHPLQSFTNYAWVTAGQANGPDLTDSERAEVIVVNPGIDIEKYPEELVVQPGGDAVFDLVVSNFGDQPLSNVVVDDALCDIGPEYISGDANNDGILQTTESWLYRCIVEDVQSDFLNTASVEAKDPNDITVEDNDTADVFVVDAGIDVTKTTNTPDVVRGSDVAFAITLRNTGQEVLASINLSDPLCDVLTGPTGDTGPDGQMDPNEAWGYVCTVNDVQEDFTNTASVTAVEQSRGAVVRASASTDINVINPDIDLEKTPAQQTVREGENVTFSLTVRNPGSVDLENVQLQDALCDTLTGPAGDDGDGILQPSETWTYTCVVSNAQTDFINTALVQAQAGNNVVIDSDDARVTVVNPTINVTKVTDQPVAAAGTDVTFTILVENTGQDNLTNVQVSDPRCTVGPAYLDGDDGDFVLEPNETWRYVCTITNVQEDFVNTATAQASIGNTTVSDSGSASVDVVNPEIDLEKRPIIQTVVQGNNAIFSITVRNTGTGDLNDVVVTDGQCTTGPDLVSNGDGDSVLSPGETWVYSCVIENVQDDLINVASVSARSGTRTVTDSDSAAVQVVSNAVDISIGTNTDVVITGANVEILTTVRNRTSTDLQILSVTIDPCPTTPTYVSGDANGDGWLNLGESWNYRCRIENVQSGFTVTATVQAQDRDGNAVSDTDSLDITDIELPDLEKLYLPLVWQRWP